MKISKEKIGIFIVLNLAFLIYSSSSVVAKINALTNNPLSIRFFLFFGVQLFAMVVYTVLWQISIKKLDLNIAFSLKAITIIWSLIFAKYIFNEVITFNNILGVLIIIVGIVVVVRHE